MPKLRGLAPMVQAIDTRTVRLPPKAKDEVYTTPEYLTWRTQVMPKAGGRCEAIEDGQRCTRAWPEHRVYPDHIVEIKDGGAVFDPNNGQALCASHHQRKTFAARMKRFGSS